MAPTINPSRARLVWAVMKPSAVVPSSMGSSISPTLRIWNRWSMTQIESKPASSAARHTRARVGPIWASPPGQEKDEIWRPIFTLAQPRLLEEVHLRRHDHVAGHAALAADLDAAYQHNRLAARLTSRQLSGRADLVGNGDDRRV